MSWRVGKLKDQATVKSMDLLMASWRPLQITVLFLGGLELPSRLLYIGIFSKQDQECKKTNHM